MEQKRILQASLDDLPLVYDSNVVSLDNSWKPFLKH